MQDLSVLIVDDDASVQNVLREILSDGGFLSEVACSGEEAAALLIAKRYRMLIVDISLEGIAWRGGQSLAVQERLIRRCRSYTSPEVPSATGQFTVCRTAYC